MIFKSHAYVCEWTGVGRVVIAGKELAQQCGGPRPRLPPPLHGLMPRKIQTCLNKTTTTDMSCVATSSTVKDDVSALFWVLGFHLNKVLRISTAQEESDINSTSTQKYKNICLLWFCVVSNSKTFPAGRCSIQFFMLLFSNYLYFFLSSVVLSSKLTITYFWNRNINLQ